MAFFAAALPYITAATAAAGVGTSIYAATRSPPKPPPKPGPPPTPETGGPDTTGKQRKAYRPAAQLFKDEDLRLGSAGKLGL